MDPVSRQRLEQLRHEERARPARTRYAVQLVNGGFYAAHNQHWTPNHETALLFDHMTTAELFAFGNLDLGADAFRVVPV